MNVNLEKVVVEVFNRFSSFRGDLCEACHVCLQVDIDTLQDNVEHITFADLNEDGALVPIS